MVFVSLFFVGDALRRRRMLQFVEAIAEMVDGRTHAVGLMNILSKEQISDLLAYLESGISPR